MGTETSLVIQFSMFFTNKINLADRSILIYIDLRFIFKVLQLYLLHYIFFLCKNNLRRKGGHCSHIFFLCSFHALTSNVTWHKLANASSGHKEMFIPERLCSFAFLFYFVL